MVDMANTLENEQYWGIDRIKEDLDKVRTVALGHNFIFYRTILEFCAMLLNCEDD